MNQLKRKSVGGSGPSPDKNEDGDAPSKRAKIEGHPVASPSADETRHMKGAIDNEDDSERHEELAVQGMSLKQGSLSPSARPPGDVVATKSPQRERRLCDSRRPRGSSPRAQSPDRGRRIHDSRRHSPPPSTRSTGQDGLPYDSRRHGRSPPSRPTRRESDVEESGERPEATLGDRDRNRRAGLSREEEKKRGKRLFGGLLSTLSQNTSNSQQKRRQEIEKRQQEKAAKQKIEDDKRRSEGLEKLDRTRKIDQVRFDEQVMNTRHSNMLAMAHSLQTKSEPKLYYRPWEPTQEQEDIIKDQIRDAKAQIEDELQRFRVRKEQRLKDLGALPPPSEVDATVGEPAVEDDRSRTAAQDDSAASATNDRRHSPATAPIQQHPSHEERDHDEMVEAAEDTLIY